MNYQNDDLRIKEIKELLPPVALLEKFPARFQKRPSFDVSTRPPLTRPLPSRVPD